MSRAMASVGFSPTRWKGARKMPNVSPLWLPVCAMNKTSVDSDSSTLLQLQCDVLKVSRWGLSQHGACRSTETDRPHGDPCHSGADVPGVESGAGARLLRRGHHGQLPGTRHAQPR